MNYKLPNSNKQSGFELHSVDEAFAHLLPEGCIQITDAEALAIQELNGDVADPALAARDYLTATDWYVIRKLETGKEIPADVLEKRQAARDRVQAT